MKRYKYSLLVLSVSLVLAQVLFVACTDDDDSQKKTVQIIPSFSTLTGVEIYTRASSPSGDRYSVGDFHYQEAETYPIGTKIGVHFAKGSEKSYEVNLTNSSCFTYKGNQGWDSNVSVEVNTPFTVFGHVPQNCCNEGGSVKYYYDADNDEHKPCIVMKNVKVVSDADFGVVVGVGKNHYWKDINNNTLNDGGAKPACFTYSIKDETDNQICLLIDHLFAQTKFHFSIEDTYNRLRDIRIQQISLGIMNIESLDVTVPLKTTWEENLKTAIDGEPVWTIKKFNSYEEDELKELIITKGWKTEDELVGKEKADLVWIAEENSVVNTVIYDHENIELPVGYSWSQKEEGGFKAALAEELEKGYLLRTGTAPVIAPGFFMPVASADQPVKFRLIVKYDVYDKAGKKTRSNQTAINYYTSRMKDTTTGEYVEIKRGNSYNINVTVKPTYLYQLSEYDLDNPGLTISTTTNP